MTLHWALPCGAFQPIFYSRNHLGLRGHPCFNVEPHEACASDFRNALVLPHCSAIVCIQRLDSYCIQDPPSVDVPECVAKVDPLHPLCCLMLSSDLNLLSTDVNSKLEMVFYLMFYMALHHRSTDLCSNQFTCFAMLQFSIMMVPGKSAWSLRFGPRARFDLLEFRN